MGLLTQLGLCATVDSLQTANECSNHHLMWLVDTSYRGCLLAAVTSETLEGAACALLSTRNQPVYAQYHWRLSPLYNLSIIANVFVLACACRACACVGSAAVLLKQGNTNEANLRMTKVS